MCSHKEDAGVKAERQRQKLKVVSIKLRAGSSLAQLPLDRPCIHALYCTLLQIFWNLHQNYITIQHCELLLVAIENTG